MDIGIILNQCIDQCVDLERQIENDCQLPPDCLGGQMRPAYEEVREKQLAKLKDVCNQLRALRDSL